MVVAVLDANFVITAVNDESQVVSREASVGTSFADIFTEADRQTVSDALARSAGGGMERVDGVSFFIVRAARARPKPTFHGMLLTIGLCCDTMMDSSVLPLTLPAHPADHRRSLRNSKICSIKAPIAMHWLSSDGKVLWANDRELEVLGYSREEYIGADIKDFCPDSEDDVVEIVKQLRSGETIRDVPIRVRTKAGKIKDLLIDSIVAYKTDGSFNHTQCFARGDMGRIVTEARTEAAATAASKLAERKERFSSILLHNIRTPLHIMTMNLSNPVSIDVPVLASQLGKLAGLCASVAQAMKFDDGYFITPVPTPTSLSSLVRECRSAQGVRHEVVIEELGFDESLVVLADGNMIRPVLHELIALADGRSPAWALIRLLVKHQKGEAQAKGEGEGHHFEFRVVDRGEKLDDSQVEKAFHHYWLGNSDDDSSTEATSSDEAETERTQRLASLEEKAGLRRNVAFNYVQCLGSILRVVSDTSTTTCTFTLALQTTALSSDPGQDVGALHSRKETPASPRTPATGTSTTFPRLKLETFPKHHQPGMAFCDAVCRTHRRAPGVMSNDFFHLV